MYRVLVLVCFLSGVAVAQSSPPPPPAGAPAPPPGSDPAAPAVDPAASPAAPAQPGPPASAAPPAQPAPPPQSGYYQPQGPYQPQGYYQPQGAPMYGQPRALSLRNGMTFEANLGLGWIRASADGESDTSDLGIGGLSLGVGGWTSPKVALTARLSGVTLSENGAQLSHVFLGPAAQYWVDDHFWLGGGAGLSILAASNDVDRDSVSGFGLDLRIGYTFTSGSENTVNVSLELNPGWYSENGSSATFTGIGFLFGYQHL